MHFKRSFGWLIIAGFLALLLSPAFVVRAAEEKPWQEQAEETFYLGRGMGRQLMTQEEWQEHRQKMQTMGPEERATYREEWHKKMIERAKERGITMPEMPGPHRKGKGTKDGDTGGYGGSVY